MFSTVCRFCYLISIIFRAGLDCHITDGGLEPCTFRSTKNIIFGDKKKDDGVHPVLDSLDNYKILSERMNVLTIYLPWGKIGTCIASDLRTNKVKTAVH